MTEKYTLNKLSKSNSKTLAWDSFNKTNTNSKPFIRLWTKFAYSSVTYDKKFQWKDYCEDIP